MTTEETNILSKYFKDTLGVEVEIRAMGRENFKSLPLAIASLYKFYRISLFKHEILLVEIQDEFTTDRLKKHFEVIGQAMKMPCVALVKTLESYTRTRLIDKGIQFVIPGKQMYLPNFLVDLKEFGNHVQTIPAQMPPSAQFLLLYHIQVNTLEGYNFKQIAEKLFYNAMTITRAAYYLHNTGLCEIRGTKDKELHFNLENKSLWKAAEPLMLSPVKQAGYYSGWLPESQCKISNITALSHFTNINPDAVEHYAIRPGMLKHLLGANFKYSGPMEGNMRVEEWKYEPELLTKNEYVDPLSLYLCFRDTADERIQMALEQLIENIKW